MRVTGSRLCVQRTRLWRSRPGCGKPSGRCAARAGNSLKGKLFGAAEWGQRRGAKFGPTVENFRTPAAFSRSSGRRLGVNGITAGRMFHVEQMESRAGGWGWGAECSTWNTLMSIRRYVQQEPECGLRRREAALDSTSESPARRLSGLRAAPRGWSSEPTSRQGEPTLPPP